MIEHAIKKRRIENNTQEFFILNSNNINNYKYSNPINLIIINTNYRFENIFLETIINGGMKENVIKIITSDLVISKYIEKISNTFGYLFPTCDTIQVNSFNNDFTNLSTIIDNLKIVKNLEYNLDEHIFINNNPDNSYLCFIGLLLTGYLTNIKNITIRNKTNMYNFNDFISRKIIQDDIINKHNSYQINLIYKARGFENIHTEEGNFLAHNKYINLINFKFIDFNEKMILNDILINVNQKHVC